MVPFSFYKSEDKVVSAFEKETEDNGNLKEKLEKEEKKVVTCSILLHSPFPNIRSFFDYHIFTIPTLTGEIIIPPPECCS